MKRLIVRFAIGLSIILFLVTLNYASMGNNVAEPLFISAEAEDKGIDVIDGKADEIIDKEIKDTVLILQKEDRIQKPNEEIAVKVRKRISKQIDDELKEKAKADKESIDKVEQEKKKKETIIVEKKKTIVKAEAKPVKTKVAKAKAAQSKTTQQKAVSTNVVSERDLFIAIVDVEGSSESFESKLAIANVILNRVKFGWGGSIKSVVYARGQFPPAHNGVLAKRIANGPWSSDSVRAVDAALSGKNNIGNAQSFNAYYGQRLSEETKIIDGTIFYNFK